MKVKKLIILAIFMAGTSFTNAQDIITLKTGDEINAKVTEISSSEIKYKRFDNLEGPTIVISSNTVFFIKYENGTKEIINVISETPAQTETLVAVSNKNPEFNYAILHIYRRNDFYGSMVKYDLSINKNVICQVKNKWYETVKIDEEGLITLWAKTEAKKELPIIIEFGKEYYVRCSVTTGAFVGHPHLELVDEQIGKSEIQNIDGKKKKK
jgi:hypothetical protein